VTVATLVISVWLYFVVPKGLFPQQDTGALSGFSEAPQDVSFATMKERQDAVNKIVLSHPAVEHSVSFIGGGGAPNTGFMFVQLRPLSQRKLSADQIIADLRPKLARATGITLYLQSVQDVRTGGRGSRTQYQYTLEDANLDELLEWSPRVLEKLRTLPQLRDVNTDQQTAGLQLYVHIDRDTASRLGITPAAVD